MTRLRALVVTTMSAITLGALLLANNVDAQQKSPQLQLVGAWTFVSLDSVRNDGTKVAVFGSNPKGTLIFTGDGHFALVQMRADIPRIASNSRDQGTPDEYKAIVQSSIAYFGTYSLNDEGTVITLNMEGSTFANLVGGGEQKRIITTLTADELRFANPKNPSGTTLEVAWTRAK